MHLQGEDCFSPIKSKLGEEFLKEYGSQIEMNQCLSIRCREEELGLDGSCWDRKLVKVMSPSNTTEVSVS